jgi:hypothetical protein
LKLVIISDLKEILLWSEPMDLILLKFLEARRKVYFGMILEFLILAFIALDGILGEIVIFCFVVARPLWNVRIWLIGI